MKTLNEIVENWQTLADIDENANKHPANRRHRIAFTARSESVKICIYDIQKYIKENDNTTKIKNQIIKNDKELKKREKKNELV